MCKKVTELYPQCKHSVTASSPELCEAAQDAGKNEHCETDRKILEGLCPNCKNAADIAAIRAQRAGQSSSSAAGSAGPASPQPRPQVQSPPPVIEVDDSSDESEAEPYTKPKAEPSRNPGTGRTFQYEQTIEVAPGDTQALDTARREMDALAARLRRQDAVAHAEVEVEMRSQGVKTPQEADDLAEVIERSVQEIPSDHPPQFDEEHTRRALETSRWREEQEVARQDAEQLRLAFEESHRQRDEVARIQQAAHDEQEREFEEMLRRATEASLAKPPVDHSQEDEASLQQILELSAREHDEHTRTAQAAETEELNRLLALSQQEHEAHEQRRLAREHDEEEHILRMSLLSQEADEARRVARATSFYKVRYRFDRCGHEIDGGLTQVPRDRDADDLPFFLEDCRGSCPDCVGEGSGAPAGRVVPAQEQEQSWYPPTPPSEGVDAVGRRALAGVDHASHAGQARVPGGEEEDEGPPDYEP